jgi:succinate dehydrogenase/fumarate reductase cytochrome b subunit
MKNTKLNKVLITVLCFAMVVTMSATVLATTTDIGGITINPQTKTEGADSAAKIGNQILGIIQVVGIILSVGCLMILGIKYMMGSAEEKAEYKKTFIPYLIGALLLFAASAFAKTIYNWVTNIKV